MSFQEFKEWLAYDQIHPLPDPWLQTAVIGQTTALCNGIKADLTDFMPTKPREQSPTEARFIFEALVSDRLVEKNDEAED